MNTAPTFFDADQNLKGGRSIYFCKKQKEDKKMT